MKLSDSLDLKGKLTIHKVDINNQTYDEIIANNDITLSGRELVAKLFSPKDEVKPVDQIRLGTGTKDFKAEDNELAEPITEHFINIETSDIKTEENNRIKLTLTGNLKEDDNKVNGQELTEACLYSSGSKVMYNRVQFPVINKTENFKLTLIWEILF